MAKALRRFGRTSEMDRVSNGKVRQLPGKKETVNDNTERKHLLRLEYAKRMSSGCWLFKMSTENRKKEIQEKKK